jgi:hypothetical protein
MEALSLILLTVNEQRNLDLDITQKSDSTYGQPRDWHTHSNLRTQIESIESSSKVFSNLMQF